MRRNIHSWILISIISLFCLSANAQYVFVLDQTGKPVTENKYENLTGSPYLTDNWTSGEIKLADGKTVKHDKLKYNQVEDELYFYQDDKVYEFTPKVIAFTLLTPNGNKTFLLKDKDAKISGYFEVLSEGKISLLKKTRKIIIEAKGYNSATKESKVDENKKYYLISTGVEKEVKLSKNDFLEALPEFKASIENYFKAKKKNTEETFIGLVTELNIGK